MSRPPGASKAAMKVEGHLSPAGNVENTLPFNLQITSRKTNYHQALSTQEVKPSLETQTLILKPHIL